MISFFIPIKKVSRRIPNKNTKRIHNYKFGLTEIKIKHLIKLKKKIKQNKLLNKIDFEFVISSDDDKIKNYIKNFKWIKFDKRPKKLAKDDCLDELIRHVPRICSGKYIVWTHVTSPFFDHNCYSDFLTNFLKNKSKYDSGFTADRIKSFIFNSTKKNWISHNRRFNKWPRTQDLDKIYKINHAAFIAKRQIYEKLGDRIGSKPLPVVSKKNFLEAFDIDEKIDFKLLNKIIRQNEKTKNYR
tara:strand:+ start:396 stop:1121 length:726 start_codon:yes stop_codon:yes gene_type:complete